jgi:glycosyltransferase involved in cell wall biosynthesis
VQQAIFASTHWQAQAVRAGLPTASARTIYYGVPLPPPVPRPDKAGRRILWVGRLSPEKGLHVLLRALPALRRRLPDVTVTAIAAQGSPSYRRLIARLIGELDLGAVVSVRPPIPREGLADAYAAHDVLFFHSVYEEPVALVLMEACAAGLPVAASATAPDGRLVRTGETCLTYDPSRPETAAQALHTLLTDAPLRERLASTAQRLVRTDFSLEAMGRSYDAALRECLVSALSNSPEVC